MGIHVAHALIGNTSKRQGWIGQTDGTLPTYDGPIPVGEVERRLFDWEAISVPTGNFIPSEPDALGSVVINGQWFIPKVTENAQGIVRSDDYSELGRHKGGYQIHDYKEWLIRYVSNIIQDRLQILSALTLKNGAQAAVEIGLDETVHDGESGLEFWPFLLAVTSLDGSLATTYSAFNRVLLCDNMFSGIHREASRAGRQFKVKHTANSVSPKIISDVRGALSILDRTASEMTDYIHTLLPVTVDRTQWLKVLDVIAPPASQDDSKVKRTKTENRREALDATYQHDAMVAPYTGTAFGVVQAVDTYQRHYAPVRGTSRLERVYDRTIRGDLAEVQADTLGVVAKVLDMPELVSA
jgi:phage/plasmid-like protein (TIGR03299 family)